MDSAFQKVDCIWIDEDGNIYFCLTDFIRMNKLPDSQGLRMVIIEELREMIPDMLIIEDWN